MALIARWGDIAPSITFERTSLGLLVKGKHTMQQNRGRNEPAQGTPWTIHDIARAAKVSAKTVSRVINDQPGVGPATRERIQRIIADVGYHPHIGARNMRSRKRDSVGLTLPAPPEEVPISQDLLISLLTEVYRVFGARGDFICLDMNPAAAGAYADYARGLWEHRYDACIVGGPLKIGDETIVRVHNSGHPYMALSRLDELPEVSCASVDFEKASYLSVQHLVERGHKRIALICGFAGYQSGRERQRGYLRAMEEAGLPVAEEHIQPVSLGSRDIATHVHRVLASTQVDAIIDASGAEDAASLREGAWRAGRKLGGDCDLVSWTYTNNAAVLAEACAHVWLPVMEAGIEGIERLAAWFYGQSEGPVHVVYSPTLYESPPGEEIARPQPFFDVHR